MKKAFKTIIALLLTVVLAMSTPLQVFADASEGQYIRELNPEGR